MREQPPSKVFPLENGPIFFFFIKVYGHVYVWQYRDYDFFRLHLSSKGW